MAFTPFSAKNAKVRTGGSAATVTVKKWTVEMAADELDTSNAEGAGFKDCITGLIGCTFTVEMDLDGQANANPWDSTLAWVPGTTVSTVKAYLNDTTGPYWDFPSMRCISSSNPMDVKDSGKVTYTFKTKGTFTDPTGTIAP